MEGIFALISFAFVTSVTPGPNNMLLMASGLRFGVKRTLPHILGIQVGMALQLALSAYGFGVLIMSHPTIAIAMKALGSTYLLYLAWQLRKLQVHQNTDSDIKPFNFWQAIAFQFINPKAWIMSITAGALLMPTMDTQLLSIIALCLIFNIVGAPSSGSWAVFGALIRDYMKDARWQKVINYSLVAMTIYTAVSIWMY